MKPANIVIPAVAFLAGGALAWIALPRDIEPAPSSSEKVITKVERSDRNTIKELRAKISELEKALAKASSKSSKDASMNSSESKVEVRADTQANIGFANLRKMAEDMKKNDPERYAQMTNNFAQHRARMQQRTNDRLDLLGAIDTTAMSEKDRSTHLRYQEALARAQEIRDSFVPPEEDTRSDEERRKLFDEMRKVNDELRRLEREEREVLLRQTTANLGLKGEDAKEVIDTVKLIFESTSNNGGLWGGRGGRGRR